MTTGQDDETTPAGTADAGGADTAADTDTAGRGRTTHELLEEARSRPSLLRRFLRNRTALAATVAGLAGLLIGAGTVAWRTDTLPLLRPAPCWNSLHESSLSGLFGDLRLEVDEQALQRSSSTSLSYGQCRITGFKNDQPRWRAIVRVHTLDGLHSTDSRNWPAEFLASRMVALGDGLPGMVSASRAWLALPQSCVGRPFMTQGATVVDVALGERAVDISPEYDRKDRDAMTRVVVEAANGAIRELGCTGTYQVPEKLPAIPKWDSVKPDAFCGVKGLELPAAYRESLSPSQVGGEGGAARTCEVGGADVEVRMSTVVDPTVAEIYARETRASGTRVSGTKGTGSFGPTRGLYELSCQTGLVVMVVENLSRFGDNANFVRDLLPAYVEAESERIGCGSVKVKMPRS